MADEEEYPYAPHPFGGQYGPAAITPRRGEPLLAGEIVRLFERRGIGWEQAVWDAAGLMCQTVEETEGWWAFEVCHSESPVDAQMISEKRAASGAVRPVQIHVQYDGPPTDDTDRMVEHCVGSQAVGSGFNFEANWRDMEFRVSSVPSANRIRERLHSATARAVLPGLRVAVVTVEGETVSPLAIRADGAE